ncbi:hypothetical protein DRJ25_01085 [Candidatus Woesearchaeota archaeon]|nr:MAG: hypothetical protein DRJ25_01085 [Candidatus Woesearchaeota archaeon]
MIYILKNKEQTIALTNERKQAIFDLNGTLGLSERIRNEEIKLLKKKKTLAKLQKAAIKNNISITLTDGKRIERINNTSETTIKETSQPLELLARHATDHTQFAFASKKDLRVLYGRDLGLKVVPQYFKGFFGQSGSRIELSYKVHDLLVSYLGDRDYKNAEKLIKKYVDLDFDSLLAKAMFSLFSLKRKKRDPEKKKKGRILVAAANQEMQDEFQYKIRTALSLPTYSYKHIPYLDVRCPKKDEKKIEKELSQNYEAAIAKTILLPALQPVEVFKPTYTNLVQIGAYEAQERTRGEGVRVGVIDTGIDYNHEQLRARFSDEKGYDFVSETTKPQDDNGHGTHVAGIIAGEEVGVAPAAQLFALKALDARGSGSEADIISAIDWAIENGLQVLNLSLGSNYASKAEKAAIDAALQAGIVIAAAAGNDGNSDYTFPASYAGVLSVAAVNHKNEHAYFSNYNDAVNISAPGVEIFSCYKGNSYIELSGTSMATPHVAGAAALVISLAADAHLEEILEATALALGKGQNSHLYYGSGLVRADEAVASIIYKETGKRR